MRTRTPCQVIAMSLLSFTNITINVIKSRPGRHTTLWEEIKKEATVFKLPGEITTPF